MLQITQACKIQHKLSLYYGLFAILLFSASPAIAQPRGGGIQPSPEQVEWGALIRCRTACVDAEATQRKMCDEDEQASDPNWLIDCYLMVDYNYLNCVSFCEECYTRGVLIRYQCDGGEILD